MCRPLSLPGQLLKPSKSECEIKMIACLGRSGTVTWQGSHEQLRTRICACSLFRFPNSTASITASSLIIVNASILNDTFPSFTSRWTMMMISALMPTSSQPSQPPRHPRPGNQSSNPPLNASPSPMHLRQAHLQAPKSSSPPPKRCHPAQQAHQYWSPRARKAIRS